MAINRTSNKQEIANGYFKSYLILKCISSNQTIGGVYACAAINDAGKSTESINMTFRSIQISFAIIKKYIIARDFKS